MNMDKKIIIYQIFTRLFGNRNTTRKEYGSVAENGCGKMNDFDAKTLKRIKEMGITHVWYTGVIRHATQTDYSAQNIPVQHPAVVKGKAGSPYAITDYYDVDPDLAVDVDNRMGEFEQLLERTHQQSMKVIIDFVPNHVARQYHSIAKPQGVEDLGQGDNPEHGFDPQNNFYYCPGCCFEPSFSLAGEQGTEPYIEYPAKATGNDHFDNRPGVNDWYETVKLNYGVDYYAGGVGYFEPIPNTWHKMLHILLFWAAKGVDGFRCDMAEMVPAAFWAWATTKVKEQYPQLIFIGEVYNPAQYRNYIGAGFDLLYDKVGMYDTLRAVTCHGWSTQSITQAWQATDDIAEHMLYFLENHDEQRVASSFFAQEGRRGVPALMVSLLLRSNPFMLYAAEEYGEKGMDKEGFSGCDGRTTIFDYWSIDTLCRAAAGKLSKEEKALYDIHCKLMSIACKEKAAKEGSFFDVMYVNGHLHRQYAFLRKAGNEMLLVAANFDNQAVDIEVTLPAHAFGWMGIAEKNAVATNLLTAKRQNITLAKDGKVALHLEASNGVVLKINTEKPRKKA